MVNILPTSSLLQCFIMSLTDKKPQIWSTQDQMKVQASRRGPLLDSYVWNLHSLGNNLGIPPIYTNSNSKRMDINDPYWKLIFVNSYNDDQGSTFITTTDSFNNVASFTHPVASNIITKPRIAFSPVVAQDFIGIDTDVYQGNAVIYKCFLFPSYPVLISTTIRENEHYGPVFPTLLSISVSDQGPKSVNVEAQFIGGRSLFLPPMKNIALKTTTASGKLDAVPYRTASIFDCAVEYNLFPSYENFIAYLTEKNAIKTIETTEKIISMSLQVSQTYAFNVTANDDLRKIQQGPKYLNLTDRKVTGSITYLSNVYDFYFPTSSSLTMFFGAGFYFPMQNVDWQRPKIQAVPGQGYTHTFDFVARAVDGAVANAFKANALGNYFSSEFYVKSYIDQK